MPAVIRFPADARSSTLRAVRERWFGSTGRKVAAIVLEGTVDLDGALLLDSVDDDVGLREAHASGTPVVVRATDADGVKTALARPEVACVVVTDPDLVDLDLPDLTYG